MKMNVLTLVVVVDGVGLGGLVIVTVIIVVFFAESTSCVSIYFKSG